MSIFTIISRIIEELNSAYESHKILTTVSVFLAIISLLLLLFDCWTGPGDNPRRTTVTESISNRSGIKSLRNASGMRNHAEYTWTTVADGYKCQLLTEPGTSQPVATTCFHLQYYEKDGSGGAAQWKSMSKAFLIVPSDEQDTWLRQFQFGFMEFGAEDNQLAEKKKYL